VNALIPAITMIGILTGEPMAGSCYYDGIPQDKALGRIVSDVERLSSDLSSSS